MPPRPAPVAEVIPAEERARGIAVAERHRVAVFVVAYNAESHIRATLERIPEDLRERLAAVYVIDDSSSDRTASTAREVTHDIPYLQVFRTPSNQGYGGNQKLGYQYASRCGFDVVVLRTATVSTRPRCCRVCWRRSRTPRPWLSSGRA
jgi:hypothetical protein